MPGGQNFKYQQKSGGTYKPAGGNQESTQGGGGAAGGSKYQPKPKPKYQQKTAGGTTQGQSQGSGQNYQKNYQNKQGGYQKGPQQYQKQGGAQGDKQQQFFPHQHNLQQMDQSEVQELLVNVLSMYGSDIAAQAGSNQQADAIGGLQALLGSLGGGGGGGRGGGQGGYGGRGGGAQGSYRGGYQNKNRNNFNQGGSQIQQQPNLFGQLVDMQAQNAANQMPAPILINPDDKESEVEESKEEGQSVLQQQQALLNSNICETHFPEPIIYMSDKPLCKKCVPEYLDAMKQKAKKLGDKSEEKKEDAQKQQMMIAQMLGLTSFGLNNMYGSEKNLINKCLLKLDDFKGDFRYLQDEIDERAQESNENLENLPELMCQIFHQCQKTMDTSKQNFVSELDQVILKQQQSFMNDNEVKVPTFYERLSLKYGQLQQATSVADQISQDELLEILNQYHKIFLDLDAEFEKYFNEFENVSKLQRLLDKDQNEIIKDFSNLIETNLRVDYNIKNSFHPGVPSRVHSFQWNQKYAYIFKVHNQEFEKRPVSMEFEVPLYSRSIATEDGGIYLIGGCNKRRNQYLKKCYRYNEIFANLDEKASMIFPHADHSLCAIEGFIYVVGTFVNSQVYGFCEVYDIQKDQWKQIDSLRVARSGVALSSFKNNYIFAFGGRIDQKNIVDTIECYDISKNVWQEIQGPTIDKTAWIPGYMSLSYQITDNEIIIFGGKSALTQQIFNGCFVFDVQKMTITEKGKLVNPCSFMNTPLVFGGHLYAFGNDIYIHKYNIAEQKWSCIPKAFP